MQVLIGATQTSFNVWNIVVSLKYETQYVLIEMVQRLQAIQDVVGRLVAQKHTRANDGTQDAISQTTHNILILRLPMEDAEPGVVRRESRCQC